MSSTLDLLRRIRLYGLSGPPAAGFSNRSAQCAPAMRGPADEIAAADRRGIAGGGDCGSRFPASHGELTASAHLVDAAPRDSVGRLHRAVHRRDGVPAAGTYSNDCGGRDFRIDTWRS